MKATQRIKKVSTSQKFNKRMKDAKMDYERIFTEVKPFIPSVRVKETSTEGQWQTSANLSLY